MGWSHKLPKLTHADASGKKISVTELVFQNANKFAFHWTMWPHVILSACPPLHISLIVLAKRAQVLGAGGLAGICWASPRPHHSMQPL